MQVRGVDRFLLEMFISPGTGNPDSLALVTRDNLGSNCAQSHDSSGVPQLESWCPNAFRVPGKSSKWELGLVSDQASWQDKQNQRLLGGYF